MKEKLKQAYYFLQILGLKDKRLLNRIKNKNLIAVLNFHQISPKKNPFWSPLHPDVFDELLGFWKENFEVVLFHELESVKSDKPLSVISFDDGYYDFVEYAEPILDKHKLRANMNIIPSCVDSGEPMWNIMLYDFLNSSPKSLIDEIKIPGFDYQLRSLSVESKIDFGLRISAFLKRLPKIEREELWSIVKLVTRKVEFESTRMMNLNEVKTAANMHEIGVHSFSHESMGIESNQFFKRDLESCFDFFDTKLEMPLNVYAFPNGSFKPNQIEILKNNGIGAILVVGEDYARPGSTVFPRFTIYGETVLKAKFQALGINSNRQRIGNDTSL